MKKRILSALLAAGMMLTLAGCQPETPQEMLESAAAKTNALSSAEYAGVMSAQMDMGGIQMGMDIDQTLKLINDQDNPQVEAVVSMDLFGESVEAHTIYQDGWCYVDTMGSKMKYAADYDEFLATQGENLLDATGTPTDFSSLEDVSVTQDGDNRVISFTGGRAISELRRLWGPPRIPRIWILPTPPANSPLTRTATFPARSSPSLPAWTPTA